MNTSLLEGPLKSRDSPAFTEHQSAYTFKYVIVGETSVGKSCFLLQFSEQRFKTGHEMTIGAEYCARRLNVDGKYVTLKIWDTAGSEQFRSISQQYYRGALGAILVYDVTKRASFMEIGRWLADVRMQCSPGVSIILVGNKSDLDANRDVSWAEGQNFARENDLVFTESSARTSRNVEKAFFDLTMKILQNVKSAEKPTAGKEKSSVLRNDTTFVKQKPRTKCC